MAGVNDQIARLSSAKKAIADAISEKGVTVPAGTKLDGMSALIQSIPDIKSIAWHQCPEAVRNYLANVTYDPSDYSTSQIAKYAPATAVISNYKPIGKTVGGVTYYNEVPNVLTPFAGGRRGRYAQTAGRIKMDSHAGQLRRSVERA